MKSIARSLVVVLVALIAVPALVVSVTITTAVQLLATTALIMGGTQHPLSSTGDAYQFVNEYFRQAVNHFIVPGTGVTPTDTYAVVYPAEFFPVFGSTTFDESVAEGRDNLNRCLDTEPGGCGYNQSDDVGSPNTPPPTPTQYGGDANNQFIVFGYSQSAVVASLVKQDLVDYYTEKTPPNTKFVLASNPMRPNGGILGRGFEGMAIPIFGITFYGTTPNCATGGPCFDTVDVAQQYDFLGGDAPARPLNLLAMANSVAAYAQLHGDVPNRSITKPGIINQGKYGDTQYYMIPADRLPILMPLETLGVPSAALALPDAVLRVWIEDAYLRNESPGQHVQFQIIPIGNPIALIGNTLYAIPVGIDDTVAQATGDPENRPLHTANVYRPFGVGGPVYDPTTGQRVPDNVGIPTGSGDYGTTAIQPLQPQQQTEQLQTNTSDSTATITNTQSELAADNSGTTTTPKDTKPEPFKVLRNPLKFTPKQPSASQPGSSGPLKRIVNALTGQRPQTDTTAATSDKSGPEKPAA